MPQEENIPASNSPPIRGLKLGIGSLIGLTLLFLTVFLWPTGSSTPTDLDPKQPYIANLAEHYPDAESQRAIAALKQADPGAYATLADLGQRAKREDATNADMGALLLRALFGQFKSQAYYLQFAQADDYSALIGEFARGVEALEHQESQWCAGPYIAEYLSRNDSELVPDLLDEFPYASAQYNWAMGFMTRVLDIAHRARTTPQQYAEPTGQDERILQAVGLEFGAEEWGLALQIGAFANTEGQGYAAMRNVIAQMDVCRLALAIETVETRLPRPTSARIWADLLPEIMVGNTPYALSRIMDYFFIG